MGRRMVSLFPGLGYAAGYKVLQRIYKCVPLSPRTSPLKALYGMRERHRFGGQPFIKDFLNSRYKQSFIKAFGEKNGKGMTEATAGALTGAGEVVLLPLDVLKIKRQCARLIASGSLLKQGLIERGRTNPEAFRSRGFLRIIADEGFSLYRGVGWTVARNMPGSFAVRPTSPLLPLSHRADVGATQLFGGSAFTKEYVYGLEDYSKASWAQNFGASIAGSVSSIAISQPLDVIKVRPPPPLRSSFD